MSIAKGISYAVRSGCKLSLVILMTPLVAASLAQQIVDLKPGSTAYREIVQAAVKRWKGREEFRVGHSLDVVRQYGRWALVFDRITHKGPTGEPFEWVAVLFYDPKPRARFRTPGWWPVRILVGKGVLQRSAKESRGLPAKFFTAPPVKLKLM